MIQTGIGVLLVILGLWFLKNWITLVRKTLRVEPSTFKKFRLISIIIISDILSVGSISGGSSLLVGFFLSLFGAALLYHQARG